MLKAIKMRITNLETMIITGDNKMYACVDIPIYLLLQSVGDLLTNLPLTNITVQSMPW